MNAGRLIPIIALLLALAFGAPAQAQTDDATLTALVNALPLGNFKEREVAATALAATGDPRAVPVLQTLTDGELYVIEASGQVVFVETSGAGVLATDPVTASSLGEFAKGDVEKVKVNNGLRRALRTLIGQMTLLSENRGTRLAAALSVLRDASPDTLELLDSALAAEADPEIKTVMDVARAAIVLKTDASSAEKAAAAQRIAEWGGREAITILTGALAEAPADLKPAIEAAIDSLERTRAVWSVLQNVWYGISLGSVLLLAAIGLAITFGVMGVINMAHGEMVMLGAYTTFVVQEVIRTSAPHLFDVSLVIALPLAFLVDGAVGVAIERSIIRFLYGRPLDTLLATWGLSLILQQAYRSIFGAREVGVELPQWMLGSWQVTDAIQIPINGMFVMALTVLITIAVSYVLFLSRWGRQVRAVVQNRVMAGAVGINTEKVDRYTFGLGCGIAGIAGSAFTMIGSTGPTAGQLYIVDTFLVVVFGGAASLLGTIASAFTISQAQSTMEFFLSGSMAKVLTLLAIVAILMMRPQGLFALKVRK
ncbi:MAG: urea ABC transporter permease subunit UrtB [Bradyrhizobium sp.]|nr:urea ABC transporter permease subunit UrtB [Bradyrhizobium sp.]